MRGGTECGYREADGGRLIDLVCLAFIVVIPSGRILVSCCQCNGYGSIGRQWRYSFILGHHPQDEFLLVELKISFCYKNPLLYIHLEMVCIFNSLNKRQNQIMLTYEMNTFVFLLIMSIMVQTFMKNKNLENSFFPISKVKDPLFENQSSFKLI
jgi:hypothetical protein